MDKIGLIILREYKSRVQKKSFIIMSILGPFIFASLFAIPIWIASTSTEDTKVIQVVDETGLFKSGLESNEMVYFDFLEANIHQAKNSLNDESAFGLLHIPQMGSYGDKQIKLYSNQKPSLAVTRTLDWKLQSRIEQVRLQELGVSDDLMTNLRKKIKLETITLDQAGSESVSDVGATTAVGYVGSFLIYFFIFYYGAQIMRGVTEEKTTRIIEVVIASVKPFELMIGKIIGIAGVGLTQFLIWAMLTIGLVTGVTTFLSGTEEELAHQVSNMQQQAPAMDQAALDHTLSIITSLDYTLLISCFLFYFLAGYLFYGAMFAAVGASVDSDADTQQFMLPITAPLVLSMVMMTAVLQEPHGDLALWLSIIPFTSPIIMMMRLPFDVPAWQILLSMLSLSVGFVMTTFVASKIYRIGIFVHGTKVNYRTIWGWVTGKMT